MFVMTRTPLARQIGNTARMRSSSSGSKPARSSSCARLLGQCDRALGEALEHEVVELSMRGQLDGRLDPVARVAGTRPEPQRASSHSGNTPSTTQAAVITIDVASRNGNREALVVGEINAREADEKERRRRQGTDRKSRRHLAEQRRLAHLAAGMPKAAAAWATTGKTPK